MIPPATAFQKAARLTSCYYQEGEHLEAICKSNRALRDQYLLGSVIDGVVNGYHRNANSVMVNTIYHRDALQSVLGRRPRFKPLDATQPSAAGLVRPVPATPRRNTQAGSRMAKAGFIIIGQGIIFRRRGGPVGVYCRPTSIGLGALMLECSL